MIQCRLVPKAYKIKNRQNQGIGSIANTAAFSFMPSGTPQYYFSDFTSNS